MLHEQGHDGDGEHADGGGEEDGLVVGEALVLHDGRT